MINIISYFNIFFKHYQRKSNISVEIGRYCFFALNYIEFYRLYFFWNVPNSCLKAASLFLISVRYL